MAESTRGTRADRTVTPDSRSTMRRRCRRPTVSRAPSSFLIWGVPSGPGDRLSGHVITVGLPLQPVNETLTRLLLIEALTLAAAALAVGLGGGWLVRRELLPLDRLARTAREVASLPLTRGSQRLEQRVPAEAPAPRSGM